MEAQTILQFCWFQHYVRLVAVMTDPKGCFRERHFEEQLTSKNITWDPQPGAAACRIGVLDIVLDIIKNSASCTTGTS